MSGGTIIGQAYGRKIHARRVVAIDEAGDGLCWVGFRTVDRHAPISSPPSVAREPSSRLALRSLGVGFALSPILGGQ